MELAVKRSAPGALGGKFVRAIGQFSPRRCLVPENKGETFKRAVHAKKWRAGFPSPSRLGRVAVAAPPE